MATCFSCFDGLGSILVHGSNAEPKVEASYADTALAQAADFPTASSTLTESGAACDAVMHSESSFVTRKLDKQQSRAGNLAALTSMDPVNVEPMSIDSSSMEPMKIHVRAKSEDWSLGHFQVRGPISPLPCNRAMSMQDALPALTHSPDMLTDRAHSWAPLHAAAQMNPGSLMHGTGVCSPCAWYWKPKTCLNGMDCQFCHFCPDGELKSRRKAKLTVMRSAGFPPRSRSHGNGEATPQKSRSFRLGAGDVSPQKTAQVLSLSSLL